MTPSSAPITPTNPGAPSRVIQGFFVGGRPTIIQASPSATVPVRPQVPGPVQGCRVGPAAPILAGRPSTGAVQPALRPSRPPRPIVPTKAQPCALQPAMPAHARAPQPQPILPQAGRPAAVQAQAGNAFALPANFTLKPRGSGQPLPVPIQKKMESFFNTSFADVRVHVGHEAATIGALAFTHGSDLYFAPGQYNPQSAQGQQLLGHELTHVVQQRAGRVKNPLSAGVAVVQDPALEAEAERMGLRAASAPLPIQAKPAAVGPAVAPLPGTVSMPTKVAANGAIMPARSPADGAVQRKPGPIVPGAPSARGNAVPDTDSYPAPGHLNGTRLGPNSRIVQRRIWEYRDGGWKIFEPGTAGLHDPQGTGDAGKFFNDLTNKYGQTAKSVRSGLTDLMMITGSLSDPVMSMKWPEDLWKSLMEAPVSVYGYVQVGTITLTSDNYGRIVPHRNTCRVGSELVVSVWGRFLRDFMTKNGQIPYIERQEWFKNKSVEVDIDVNFYRDRPYAAQFGFHKDTAGDNLFVNLIFNNALPTPATEWTEDLTQTDPLKSDTMDRLMGSEVRATIEASRQEVIDGRVNLRAPQTIRGGVAGELAFVSWVDELVWHSTPAITSRNYYDRLKNQLEHWYVDVDPLLTLTNIFGTVANQFWQRAGHKYPDGFTQQYVKDFLALIQRSPHMLAAHKLDIETYKAQLLTAHTGAGVLHEGEEIAGDPLEHCGAGTSAYSREMGIKQRPRSNSDPSKARELLEARGQNPTRSFLRTWVRLRKKGVI